MEQLHYADEIKPAAEVPTGETKIKPAELTLAKQLIEQSSTDEFRPEEYKDTVRGRVLEAIQQKVEGQDITEEPAEAPKAKIIDLMEALKQSLAKGPAAEDAPKPARRAAEGGAKGKKRMKA
jgi:DNA end-binding protein Ku